MDWFQEKDFYTEEDINKLIESDAEESTYLEFKASGALDSSGGKKMEISKDISSFANADGGIIVYGISEDDHVADDKSFVDGNEYPKEWLEQVVQSNIQRRITGLEVHPVRFEDELDQTIYVVKIPRSSFAPHMAKDNKFYKRRNFQSVPMEEYEVRDLYHRKAQTELELREINFQKGGERERGDKLELQMMMFELVVENVSNAIEKNYKVEVQVPTRFTDQSFGPLLENLERKEEEYSYYVFYTDEPLFQGEVKRFKNFKLKLDRKNIFEIDDYEFSIKLYYSNGVKTETHNIGDMVRETEFNPEQLKD